MKRDRSTGKKDTYGIREREGKLSSEYKRNKLKFDESTYHFSSEETESEFIRQQFPTEKEIVRYHEYRKEWHRRSDEMEPGDVPLAVICELVSCCNLKCEMCYTRTPEFQKSVIGSQKMLPWETVVRLIDECAEIGVCSMLFSWRGESSMYRSKGTDGKWRDFADVLAYARRKEILEITSLSNGRMLTAPLIEKIVLAEPNWISISIDGLYENYNKIRKRVKTDKGKDPFELVTGNIKKLIEFRKKLGQTRPQIRTNTIFPAIAEDPEAYKTFMEDIGVGLVTVNKMLDFRGEELPEDEIEENWFCQYPFQRLVVSSNGTILPCPGAHNEEDELVLGRYTGTPAKKILVEGEMKSLDYPELTLLQAWKSKKIEGIRHLHRENRRKEILTCKHCRHGVRMHEVSWIPDEWDMNKMEWTGRRWGT